MIEGRKRKSMEILQSIQGRLDDLNHYKTDNEIVDEETLQFPIFSVQTYDLPQHELIV